MIPSTISLVPAISCLFFLLLFLPTEVDSFRNATTTTSPWLRKATSETRNWRRPRPPGCRWRPWVCRMGAPPQTRMRCCRNQCVDVASAPNNCGLCGFRCPFTWQCCNGRCVNTNISPFNCGRCGNRCPPRAPCTYGMCGYAQPFPPRRPRRPRWPWPPPGAPRSAD